jgi:heptaprenylglyceryl phosphate synthase
VVLESGGGADSPAPPEMISYTKKLIDIPLVVAGGVKDERYAYETIKAGADIIHVGSAAEKTNGDTAQVKSLLKKIVDGARKAGKEKR